MKCPHCSVPCIVVERQGLEVDYCVQCHGLWFDAEELHLLELRSGSPLTWEEGPKDLVTSHHPRPCPRCATPMKGKVHQGTTAPLIDLCPKGHGIWFDRYELQQLVEIISSVDSDPQQLNRTMPMVITYLSALLPKAPCP